jgi:hypothetical protein
MCVSPKDEAMMFESVSEAMQKIDALLGEQS